MTATSRRRVIAICALTLALAALLAVIARGDPDVPMTAENLAASLNAEAGADAEEGRCTSRAPARWRCEVPDAGGSTIAVYEVTASSESCWEARLVAHGERSPSAASGCL